MTIRGLMVNRRTARYMLGATFRSRCAGCGRRWHFKGMVRTRGMGAAREHYCDGGCCSR